LSAFGFVDCHSHVVPSGDDGARTIADGAALCREAARHGTRILFATPHVWPHLTLPPEREREIRAAYAQVAERAVLELRLGFELTPDPRLLREDPARYVLEGTEFVLMEVPFAGSPDTLFALAEHTEKAGLRPLIAHPERTEAVLTDPRVADELAARGWLLQVNASSILGAHGEAIAEEGWRLVESGAAALVASDGHRPTRPPHLDLAYAAARDRVGTAADALFDGSALGLAEPTRRRTASRAASTSA
jgi:protein-tyrosine phosphatase